MLNSQQLEAIAKTAAIIAKLAAAKPDGFTKDQLRDSGGLADSTARKAIYRALSNGTLFRTGKGTAVSPFVYFGDSESAERRKAESVSAKKKHAPKPVAYLNRARSMHAPEGPAVNPNNVKPTKCPGFNGDRWQVGSGRGPFSSVGIGRDVNTGRAWGEKSCRP